MSALSPFIAEPVDLRGTVGGGAVVQPGEWRPEELEEEVAQQNRLLGELPEIPESLRLWVGELADEMAALPERVALRVDPYLLVAAQNAVIGALRAVESDDVAAARRALRVRLEQVRQVYRDLAEGGPLYEDRPAKEIARWLSEVLDTPQAQIAELVGVSARTFQRWVSESESAAPDSEDARRLRVIAATVNHLRHSMTGPGVIAWFRRPHPDLAGKAPMDLLNEPDALTRLSTLAASARSFSAS